MPVSKESIPGAAPDAPVFDVALTRPAPDAVVLAHPSVLASWVFDLLREACALSPNRTQARLIDRDHEIEPAGERSPFLYLSHYPSPALRAAWRLGRTPVLLCLDDPVDSVRYLQAIGGGGLIETLRAQTVSAAHYAELRERPRVLILHRLAKASVVEIVDAIVSHLQLGLDAEDREALCARRLPPGQPDAGLEQVLAAQIAGYAPLGEGGVDGRSAATIGGVLAPLLQMSFRDIPGPVIWPIEAFFSGDKPETPALPVAELTGAARILYYGPYFYLPPGSWKVRLTVSFSADIRSLPFTVEVYAGQQPLAIATMKAAHGVYHAMFGFVHDDPSQAIEIRIRTDRGAIEGRFALGAVEFTRETGAAGAD